MSTNYTRMITTKLDRKLLSIQETVKKFRVNCETNDHLLTMKLPKEKSIEYNRSLICTDFGLNNINQHEEKSIRLMCVNGNNLGG